MDERDLAGAAECFAGSVDFVKAAAQSDLVAAWRKQLICVCTRVVRDNLCPLRQEHEAGAVVDSHCRFAHTRFRLLC